MKTSTDLTRFRRYSLEDNSCFSSTISYNFRSSKSINVLYNSLEIGRLEDSPFGIYHVVGNFESCIVCSIILQLHDSTKGVYLWTLCYQILSSDHWPKTRISFIISTFPLCKSRWTKFHELITLIFFPTWLQKNFFVSCYHIIS